MILFTKSLAIFYFFGFLLIGVLLAHPPHHLNFGAGPTGLVAALEALQQGLKFTVIEKRAG